RVEDEVLAGLLAGPRRVGCGGIWLAQIEHAGLLGAAERGAIGRDLVERAGLLGAAERGAAGRDLVERAGLLGAAEHGAVARIERGCGIGLAHVEPAGLLRVGRGAVGLAGIERAGLLRVDCGAVGLAGIERAGLLDGIASAAIGDRAVVLEDE